jgi:hypothetical protein
MSGLKGKNMHVGLARSSFLYCTEAKVCFRIRIETSTDPQHWFQDVFIHRLNMELDLQSLFIYVYSCTHLLRPRNPYLRILAHKRGRSWSANIDDISLWPPVFIIYSNMCWTRWWLTWVPACTWRASCTRRWCAGGSLSHRRPPRVRPAPAPGGQPPRAVRDLRTLWEDSVLHLPVVHLKKIWRGGRS